MANSVLFFSGHDYRSARRANIHFIAKSSLRLFDHVSFVSIGFSPISSLKNDTRLPLASRANMWETVEGIRCFLWKTPFHPINIKSRIPSPIVAATYKLYSVFPNKQIDAAIENSGTIVLESGLSPILIDRIVKLNPRARLIYIASDLLDTIGVHRSVSSSLERWLERFDVVRIAARAMAPAFSKAAERVRFVPHGIDKSIADLELKNPYSGGTNIVSVGSMLFDVTFFQIAAEMFPNVKFHIIGAKGIHDLPENVHQYPETPFLETLPYIKYADAGVAPYRESANADYLADSSMKLTQYGFMKLPAICPYFAKGEYPGRYGYKPGDANSIKLAIEAALLPQRDRLQSGEILSWDEVTERIYSINT